MPSLARARLGWMAAAFALAAGVSMFLITRVDTIEYAPQRWLYVIAGWLLVLSAIGPLLEMLDTFGHILLWNGIGWSAGLALFGLESVGSMPIWPLLLAALALTFWPKSPERPLPPGAIIIALGGGFTVCWLGWSDISLPIPSDWLEVN